TVGIPDLSRCHRALPGRIESAAHSRADFAEVALAFRRTRHTRARRSLAARSRALVIHKEESLVFADGAAKGSAELVLLSRRDFRPGQIVEPVIRVKRGVLQEFIQAAVELVGP